MTTISKHDFRRDADAVILKVQQGETVVLTDDGKPTVRMEPVVTAASSEDAEPNLLTSLCKLGEQWVEPGPKTSLTNEEIDRIIYGL